MTKKVFLILLSFALVLSMGLTACAGPVEEEEEEEEVVYEYITLGAPLPIGYNDGIATRQNLLLAIDEINDAGGLTVGGVKYKFKLEVMDTEDLKAGVPASDVQAVVEKLILDKKVDFIIGGPMRSDTALAVMDTVATHKIVTIWSAGFLSPGYGTKFAGDPVKYKYCFRTQGSVTPLGSEFVAIVESIAAAKGLDKKAYIVFQGVAHARAAGNATRSGLEAKGWTIVGYDEIPTGTTSFDTVLDSVAASGAKVLVLWFDMPESATLLRGWYERKLNVLPVGFVVPAHDPLAWGIFGGNATDAKCEYLVNCFPKAGITGINPQATHYINLHKSKYGTEPALTWVGPVSYQVVYILKDALERAGSLNADAVITALEGTSMTGVYGKVSFDANHDIVYSMDPSTGAITTWVQWVDGKRVPVYPPVVKTADVVLPHWMTVP